MPNRGAADVVFVIDASGSMMPCIEALKANIAAFASSVEGPNAAGFDLRLEFVALKVDPKRMTYIVDTSRCPSPTAFQALYSRDQEGEREKHFWSTPKVFVERLTTIQVGADEDSLMALDFALDLPWRKASSCHRVVVLLTDEPPETGVEPVARKAQASALVQKINDLRVKLFMVGPYSDIMVELQSADGADQVQIDDDDVGGGLASVDFTKVMGAIAKSISVASLQSVPRPVKRALFGQDAWVMTDTFDMHGSS